MNRVISLAEKRGIQIFNQDTDSMHIFEKVVPRIDDIFKFNYYSELIGQKMHFLHQ